MPEFGTGLSLDESFDLELSAVGDLEKTDGNEELQKDLAMQTSFVLRDTIGQPDNPEIASQIRSRVKNVVGADDRVEEVIAGSIDISRVEFERNDVQYTITLQAVTDNRIQELVFEI